MKKKVKPNSLDSLKCKGGFSHFVSCQWVWGQNLNN